jgi:RNA polymerase sigma-70 factor (ECF subfamily)
VGPEELGRLIDSHAAALTLYARQWCAAPEDVVQEAFLKLTTQTLRPDNPVAWLYRVVRNGAISAGRSARRRKWHESIAAEHRGMGAAWFAESEDNALDAPLAAEALQELPPEQREAIVAHLWGGLTFAEVAQLMDSSSSTVHRWYLAGLAALRERLGVPCPKQQTTRE